MEREASNPAADWKSGTDIIKILSNLENKNIEDIAKCAKAITGIPCNYGWYIGFDCANKSLGYTLASVNIGLGDQLDALDLEFWAVIEKELSENLASYKKSGEEFLSARTLAQKNKAQSNFYTEADKFISAILSSKNSSAILRAMVKYFYVTYFLKVTYFVPAKCGVLDLIPGKKLKDSDLMERTRSLKKELTSLSVPESAIVLIEDQPTIINNKSNTIQDQICYEFSNHEIYMVPPKWKNRLCFGKGLSYEEIKSKYAKKYTANKVHSKLNFLKLIDIVCENKMLEGIAKENYDDLADSCMQIIAYLQFK